MWKPRLRSRAPPEHAIERRLCTGRTRSHTHCCHLPAGGRRRRPKRRGAPPQAADSRCAKLNAIFGSAVLPLTSKSGTNRAEPAPQEAQKPQQGRADSAPRAQGRRRRLKRCGAPPQAADSRCAKLNAIFGSAVLALSTNFGTNRLALGLSPALRLSLHSESVRRREGSRSGLRTPLCADKRYGAE